MSDVSAPEGAGPADYRLRLKTVSGYGAIQMGINAVSTTCLVHLLFFYTDVVHLTPGRAGLVILLGHIWDGVTDPLMGIISDRVRWRRGRRRPFFIPGAVLMAASFGLLFMPPAPLEGMRLFWYMLVTYILFCTGRTVLDVPYNALTPELTTHYDERSRLAGWRTGLMVLGDMLGGLLPIAMLITLSAQRPAFTTACAALGSLSVLCSVYGTWGTFERPQLQPGPAAPPWRDALRALRGQSPLTLLRTGLDPLWSRPALVLILTYGMVVIGTAFPYTTFRYVSKYYFNDPDMDLWIMIAYQVAGLFAAPIWIFASKWGNKTHAYQAAIFGYAFAAMPVLFCTVEDRGLFLAAMAGCGFCGTGIWMLPNAIAPDVIEWHRLTKASANEGAFYGMWSFTGKFAGGITPWIVGITLDYVGWVPDANQDWSVLYAILAMFSVYPIIFLGLGAVLFTWYPITRERYHEIAAALEGRGEAGTA